MDEEMIVSYDRQSDVLYFSYGEAREAISEESEDGVLIRRDPRSNEILGFTVIDFSRRFAQSDTPIILPQHARGQEVPA